MLKKAKTFNTAQKAEAQFSCRTKYSSSNRPTWGPIDWQQAVLHVALAKSLAFPCSPGDVGAIAVNTASIRAFVEMFGMASRFTSPSRDAAAQISAYADIGTGNQARSIKTDVECLRIRSGAHNAVRHCQPTHLLEEDLSFQKPLLLISAEACRPRAHRS